jgi:iron complex outermembrane recepter protein
VVNLESKVGRGATPVDFNAIPLSAIKRIEVLRDGAGAQYGSDAIAGVINIILDDKPEGATFTASYGAHVTDFTYPTFTAPFTRGADKTESLTDGETVTLSFTGGLPLGDKGFLRAGAEFRDRQSTERGGVDGGAFFIFPTPVGTGAANTAFLNQKNFRAGDPKTQDVYLWANAGYDLANGVALYGNTLLSQREGEGAAFFRYPDSTQNVPALYPNGFRPVTTGDSLDISATGGFKGEAGGFAYDVSVNYGANSYEFGSKNTLNASFGAQSPTAFKLAQFDNDLLELNVDLTRELSIGLASPVQWALGAEVRRETFESKAGDPRSYQAGPITTAPIGAQGAPGLAPADAADVSRTVAGLYTEFGLDFTEALSLTLAARYENYDDFGDALAGKAAFRFAPNDVFAVRGSLSNSLRAPSLAQSAFSFSTSQFGPGGTLNTIRTLSNNSPIARALGAASLDPEKSVNATLGVVITPTPDFSITVDAFQIKVDDRITLSESFFSPALTSFIQTGFGVAGVQGINFFTNAVDTKTEGFDVVVRYGRDLFDGRLNLSAGFNRSENTIENVKGIPSQLAALGISGALVGPEERNTLTTAAPNDKATLTGQWGNDKISLLARATYYGETERVFSFFGPGVPSQRYGAKTQLDLEGEYQLTEKVSLALGGANVLDTYADRSSDDVFTAGVFPYDVISPIGFNGRYLYGRLKVSF